MRWIATTLVALLALSYAIVVFSAPSAEVHPSPNDAGIGGLSLLARAMREGGYRVAFDDSSRPKLNRDDVPVVPVLVDGQRFQVPPSIQDHVAAGGTALVVGIPETLQPVGSAIEVYNRKDQSAKIDQTSPAGIPRPEKEMAEAAIWFTDLSNVAELVKIGKGRVAWLEEGALATNRFLGRADNAKVVFSTLRTVARPGQRLVFVAGGYGEASEMGPIEAIGPWAVGVLWQSLAILGAYGIARGIRFGLSAPEIRKRRGARELLDAVASQYRRDRRTDAPLVALARSRPDDATLAGLVARPNLSETEVRSALSEFESRPKSRRPS